MPIAFSRSTRSLQAESSRRSGAALAIAMLVLGGWAGWLVLARTGRYEVTEIARLEVDRAVHAVQSPVAGRLVSSRLALDREVEAGEALIEIDAVPERLEADEVRSRVESVGPRIEALRQEMAALERAQSAERETARVAIEQAAAQLREAEAEAHLADQEHRRTSQLYEQRLTAQREAARVEAEAQTRRAAVERLRLTAARLESEQQKNDSDRAAHLDRLRGEIARLEGEKTSASKTVDRLTHEIGRRVVRAPVAGRLGDVAILREGAFVKEGDKLATLIPSGSIKLVGEFAPPAALGRIREGQRARFRLHGFPWAQYGAIDAAVRSAGGEVRDGRVRVELSVLRSAPLIPLQHGLPGTLEVHVEDISPAELVLRAAGRMIAAQRPESGR